MLKQLVYGDVKGGSRYGDLAGCYDVSQVARGVAAFSVGPAEVTGARPPVGAEFLSKTDVFRVMG